MRHMAQKRNTSTVISRDKLLLITMPPSGKMTPHFFKIFRKESSPYSKVWYQHNESVAEICPYFLFGLLFQLAVQMKQF